MNQWCHDHPWMTFIVAVLFIASGTEIIKQIIAHRRAVAETKAFWKDKN